MNLESLSSQIDVERFRKKKATVIYPVKRVIEQNPTTL